MNDRVAIDCAAMPDWVFNAASRIISKSIRRFYDDPKNRKGYEEWLKTPEGQRALEQDKEYAG